MPESKPLKLSIPRKVILGVCLAFSMIGLIALVSLISTHRVIEVSDQVSAAREILDHGARVQRFFMEMESGVRGFLLSGDDAQLKAYDEGQSSIITELQTLRKLTAGSKEQLLCVTRLQTLIGRGFAQHAKAIDKRREDGVAAVSRSFADPEAKAEYLGAFAAIDGELGTFDKIGRAQLDELRETMKTTSTVNRNAVLVSTAFTWLALLAAGIVLRRDMAERRRAQDAVEAERQLLRSIMDTIPDHIFVKDIEGRYTRNNAAHRRHLGVGDEKDVIGKSSRDFFPPAIAAAYSEDDRALLLGTRAVNNVEERGCAQDGRAIWLETTKVLLRDPAHKPIGIVGVSSDITERREMDEQLRHYSQALQRSNDELQNFASVASHDLQEPLRKVQAFGDRLRARYSKELGDQGRDFLARMLDAANRMQVLIHDLLQLTRVTTRALPFEKCRLDDILRGVLADLEVVISGKGAKVTITGLPTIEADATQMRQLFQNLLVNALKFQLPGARPEVTIVGSTKAHLGGELPGIPHGAQICEICVQDNGIGFEAQFAEHIFSPFKRLHGRMDFDGSGIGLSVCRKITDRHYGRIVAQSGAGRGATFVITLPIQQPQTL